ncbi:hypothetical protein, partial [Bacillus cereus]|uniref:hypothetical protein n=1 Tax=Bacillus cereus TaxID=1396 RepID=UPI000C017F5D
LSENPKNKNFLKIFPLILEVFSIMDLLIYQYFELNSFVFYLHSIFYFLKKRLDKIFACKYNRIER